MKQTIGRGTDLLGQIRLHLNHCHEFCTIVMRAGKCGHALANTNIYAVPSFVIGCCRPNVLKRQNEQEMQSQLVGY